MNRGKTDFSQTPKAAVFFLIFLGSAAAASYCDGLKTPVPTISEQRLKKIEDLKNSKGSLSQETAVVLAEYLKDSNTEVILGSLELLEKMGPDAAPAVPALILLLQDKTTHYQYFHSPSGWGEGISQDIHEPVFKVLMLMGPAAKEAVPAVLEIFNQHKVPKDSADVLKRDQALEVLAKLGPSAAAAVPVLTDYIKDTTPLNQWFHSAPSLEALPFIPVFKVFQNLGSSAKSAVPALIKYTQVNHCREVRDEALKAVASIEPENQELYPALLSALSGITSSYDREDIDLALDLLKKKTSFSKEEIKHTIDFLNQITQIRKNSIFMNEPINHVLCDVFLKQKEISGEAVPVLAKIVDDYPSQGAMSGLLKVINTLGEFGPTADAAVPALKKKVLDPWFTIPGYREAGIEALRKINTVSAQSAMKAYEAKKKTNFY